MSRINEPRGGLMAMFEKTNNTVRQEFEPIAVNAKQQEDDHIGWLKWVRVTATQELIRSKNEETWLQACYDVVTESEQYLERAVTCRS